MAVGVVGNAIYVNQQTASVASVVNNYNSRIDTQNMFAQAMVNERDEKVLNIRPAEENQNINPDSEHFKDEANQENERSKKRRKEEEGRQNEALQSPHVLDIKV